MTDTQPKTTGLGSKTTLMAIVAIGLIVAIGVAVFIMWRKVGAASIENKALASDINRSKTEVVQLTGKIEKRDEKISDQGEKISAMEKDIFMLQAEMKELKRQMDRRPAKQQVASSSSGDSDIDSL